MIDPLNCYKFKFSENFARFRRFATVSGSQMTLIGSDLVIVTTILLLRSNADVRMKLARDVIRMSNCVIVSRSHHDQMISDGNTFYVYCRTEIITG